jgi:protein translocase SecG subunit
MGLIIGLLSLVLVVCSVLLCLLILVQLPKKEAGMGAAFGADQAAALFGAGSGTALTQITKGLASAFLVLCLLISVLTAQASRARMERLRLLQDDVPAAASPASEGVFGEGVTVPGTSVPARGTLDIPVTE